MIFVTIIAKPTQLVEAQFQIMLFADKTNHSFNQRKNFSRNLHSSRANRFSFAHTGHQRHARSYSWNYYVEVLVVADARLRRYHDKNLENYVVTLLSIVSNKHKTQCNDNSLSVSLFPQVAAIYRHPSLEAALNIVLVRLIVLDHENVS